MQKNLTDEEIIQAYEKYRSLSAMAAHLNVPQITIFRRAQRLNLKFKNGGFQQKTDLTEILDGKHPHYQSNKLKKRLISEKILLNECSECKITEWNDNPIVLQLDHINGINSDHILSNLRLLCPNCHSQTSTYCGKNK